MFENSKMENVKTLVFEENGRGILPNSDKLFMWSAVLGNSFQNMSAFESDKATSFIQSRR